MRFDAKFNRRYIAYFIAMAAMGLSLCFNGGVSAEMRPKALDTKTKTPAGKERATFAAGCFWSMEAIFQQLKGVERAESGYAGGRVAHPSYEQVETGTTGHAESLDITFDPKVISYRVLLEVLLTARNPTTKDKQGPDEGPQYRSVIFYRNEAQRLAATEMIQKINASHLWPDPIVTSVVPFSKFYPAEGYHRNYYRLHPDQPYCRSVIAPEITEFRAKFRSRLKK